jgi:hypothetical protein
LPRNPVRAARRAAALPLAQIAATLEEHRPGARSL